jgi:hypothetical protein
MVCGAVVQWIDGHIFAQLSGALAGFQHLIAEQSVRVGSDLLFHFRLSLILPLKVFASR